MLVLHRAADPAGHLLLGQRERGVHGGDAVVEPGEQGVVEIEAAVSQDVHLGAGEEAEVLVAGIERGDGRDLR